MDCLYIYIGLLPRVLYRGCLSSTHTHPLTHQLHLAALQGTTQLLRSYWGLGVFLRDTLMHPTGRPPPLLWNKGCCHWAWLKPWNKMRNEKKKKKKTLKKLRVARGGLFIRLPVGIGKVCPSLRGGVWEEPEPRELYAGKSKMGGSWQKDAGRGDLDGVYVL